MFSISCKESIRYLACAVFIFVLVLNISMIHDNSIQLLFDIRSIQSRAEQTCNPWQKSSEATLGDSILVLSDIDIQFNNVGNYTEESIFSHFRALADDISRTFGCPQIFMVATSERCGVPAFLTIP